MKKILLTTILLAGSIYTWAQEGYPVKDIPDSLLKKADAVIRNDISEIIIHNEKSYTHKITRAITILSEKDKEYANYYMGYDLFSSISSFKGTVYDANGKKVKKIKESDLIDRSYTSYSTLFDDNRIKYYNLDYPNYPYTVVYETEMTYKGILGLPYWTAYDSYDVSVQHSLVKFSYPSNIDVRYKAYNLKGDVKTTEVDGTKTICYSIDNLKPLEHEVASPELKSYTPMIRFATDKLNYDGFTGKQSTWDEFGSSSYSLYKGRDDISPALRAQFGQLQGKPVLEIAEAIRSYMEKNTRYVSIQLGIGGWQPFKAGVVERTGFGDCKALANFAHVLFKQAGVITYPTLIHAFRNNGKIDRSFPQNYFNHVILCIPNSKDTLWMDCTGPELNLGYLPHGDSDCDVLLISENGGKLVKTPSYSSSQNLQQRSIQFDIDNQGNINGKIQTEAKNAIGEELFKRLKESIEDQRKDILEELPFSNPTLSNIAYKNTKTSEMNIVESYSLSATKYGSVVGKRIFVPVIALERTNVLPKIEKRQADIEISMGTSTIDTIKYKIPTGFKVEILPAEVDIATNFGSYKISCKAENGTLLVTRTIQLKEGKFPASKYNEMYDFYKKMSAADNSKAILIKEEN
jgi:hypothetical protein